MLPWIRALVLCVVIGFAGASLNEVGGLRSFDAGVLVFILGPFILLACAIGMGTGLVSTLCVLAAAIIVGVIGFNGRRDAATFGELAGGLYAIIVLIQGALAVAAFVVSCVERYRSARRNDVT